MKEKTTYSGLFLVMGQLFCVCLILANVLETKQLALGPVSITGGLIVFPISYIINDCIVEVWGYRRARLLIWTGFVMNFLFAVFGMLADALPAAPFWDGQEGFHAIFGLAPRIACASFLAFLVGSFLNAYVMSRMKLRDGNRRFSLRAIASTLVGESADSLVFFPIALGGIMPWDQMPVMMLTQIGLKTIYEIIALPVTIRVVRAMKRMEGQEVYDNNISYSIWKISEI